VLNNNALSLDYQIWIIVDWLKLSQSYVRQKVIYSGDFPPPLDTKKSRL